MSLSGREFKNNNYFTIIKQTGHPVFWTQMYDMGGTTEEGSW